MILICTRCGDKWRVGEKDSEIESVCAACNIKVTEQEIRADERRKTVEECVRAAENIEIPPVEAFCADKPTLYMRDKIAAALRTLAATPTEKQV